MAVNKVILIGNLGRDPEVRYTQSGSAVANLRLAVSERRKDGDKWEDHTEWVNVVCFGKTAENAGRHLEKGRQVYVEGRMQTREYTDKEGAKRWATEVVAHTLTFLGGRGDSGGGSERARSRSEEPPASATASEPGFYDDDSLPF